MASDEQFFAALTKLKGGIKEPLYQTTAVLCYEVGAMLQQAMYLYWEGDSPERLGWYKSELMDAIAQITLICESIDVNYNEMKSMGIEKALERFKQ